MISCVLLLWGSAFHQLLEHGVYNTQILTLVRILLPVLSQWLPIFISSLITEWSTCETGPKLRSLNCELTVNIIRAVPHTRDWEEQEVCPRAVTTAVCKSRADKYSKPPAKRAELITLTVKTSHTECLFLYFKIKRQFLPALLGEQAMIWAATVPSWCTVDFQEVWLHKALLSHGEKLNLNFLRQTTKQVFKSPHVQSFRKIHPSGKMMNTAIMSILRQLLPRREPLQKEMSRAAMGGQRGVSVRAENPRYFQEMMSWWPCWTGGTSAGEGSGNRAARSRGSRISSIWVQ